MKPRTLSVGAVLERWVAEFAKYGHAKVSHSTPQLATIEFVLPTLDQAYVSLEDVVTLREALEMLHLAALLDVASVEDAVAGLCYHSFEEPTEEEDAPLEDSKVSSTMNQACLSSEAGRKVEFVLTFYGTPGRFLEETLAPSFFAVNGPRSEAFLSARRELLDGRVVPVRPIDCRVNIVSMDASFDDEVEHDYLKSVVSFIELLDASAKEECGQLNQTESGDCTPMRVQNITLELNEMSITKDYVNAVAKLPATSIPVVCSRVGINPRTLACTSRELHTFLEALGTRSPKMTVEIGHVMMSEPTESLDGDGSCQDLLIRTLFQGIARSRCVTSLSFGPLLAMITMPHNRKVLWNELFTRLTDEATTAPLASLIVSPQIELTEEDAAMIKEAVSATRPAQIKSLMMWLNQSSPDAVQALVRAVSTNATTITLHSESHALTPAETVHTITRECGNLEKLSLTSAEIESMKIFSFTASPLRELSLSSVVVKDMPSVNEFLSNLADPSISVSKTLHKLHIKSENNAAEHLVLDETHAAIVEQMLISNKVLRSLELSLCDDISSPILAAIQKHDREVLAEPLPVAQQLAFLSVTRSPTSELRELHRNRVDEDVARLILGFAATRVPRHVYLDF